MRDDDAGPVSLDCGFFFAALSARTCLLIIIGERHTIYAIDQKRRWAVKDFLPLLFREQGRRAKLDPLGAPIEAPCARSLHSRIVRPEAESILFCPFRKLEVLSL